MPPGFNNPIFTRTDPSQNLPNDLFTVDLGNEHTVKVFSDDFSASGPLGDYKVSYSALNGCQNSAIADLTYTVRVINACPTSTIQIDPTPFQPISGSAHTIIHQIIVDGESTLEWMADSDIIIDTPACGVIV